jgi:GntR family transcriptional repressor for pyruvate dehydrogenase complex
VVSQRFRQPRVAEIVASKLRDDILSGRLKEGDVLPSQESLFGEFGVSAPAQMISMVLQARSATPVDVSEALMHLEPVCAGMCAARDDRMTEVVPYLQHEIDVQTAQFDDISQYVPNARRFHETLVSRCGNESMILLIGSLELIWSAHESSVWDDDGEPAPMVDKTRRAALRDHQRLLDAISDGNPARVVRLTQDHLAAARRKTLAFGTDKTIEAKLMSDIGLRLDSHFRSNGQPRSRKDSGA